MAVSLKVGKEIKAKSKGKVKIYGVSKTENKSIWTFEKKQIFLPSFLNFLIKLGFKSEDELKYFFGFKLSKEGGVISYSEDPFKCKYVNIDKLKDKVFIFEKKKLEIEIFFGYEKIIVIIRNDIKDSNKIWKLISEFAIFVENKSK